ncbi:hypothetical protein HNP40_002269 [Mycobacteroides chelonae]|nr:hypothetical protein [Mycobacteroides chelonae]
MTGYPPSVCPRWQLGPGEVDLGGAGIQGELPDRCALAPSGCFYHGNTGRIRANALRCGASSRIFGAGREKARGSDRHAQAEKFTSAK